MDLRRRGGLRLRGFRRRRRGFRLTCEREKERVLGEGSVLFFFFPSFLPYQKGGYTQIVPDYRIILYCLFR
uniref:Putative ovule protein n=1 Tax=Solanum chacoense TaxID=4108 RepID=A0A0V0GZ55_SOLCH